MSFLLPAALWTLAALALPLAIHLWRRPPRTVMWGSLRFLQSRPRRWQNLRWREYALLLTRLGLLALLAVSLARPVWQRLPFVRSQKWVLLDPAAVPAGPSLERLRALQAAGCETRLLAPGFPRVRSSPGDASAPVPDLWSLLREADATLPAGSSLAVATPGWLASLRGVRPALTNVRLEWIQTPSAQAPAAPLAKALSPLKVLILHDPERAEEARYVAAAWRAIAQADQRRVTVTVDLTTSPPPSSMVDWIFWLASQPIPPVVSAHATNVFDEATTPVANTPPGWIVSGQPPVRLWQRGLPVSGSVWWTDGFGQGLLTRAHDSQGVRWHFASRFHPAWNDLPLGPALPASLRTLLAALSSVESDDGRLADPSQWLSSDVPVVGDRLKIVAPGAEWDLRLPLWLGAVLLFGLERLLSHRRTSRPVTSAAASPALAVSR